MQTILKEILQDKILINYLRTDTDPWVNTPLQGYVYKDNKKKGKYGELLIELVANKLGYNVSNRINSGHDTIINNHSAEIKFTVISGGKGKKFTFNHVSREKDWERIIFATINHQCEITIIWTTKNELFELIDSGKYFVRQQGGSSGSNDDWMFSCSQTNWPKFKAEPCMKDFSQW